MLPQPTLSPGRTLRFAVIKTAALLACAALAGIALADSPMISEDRLFQPVDLNSQETVNGVPYGEPLAGQPFQDFTIQPPPRTFPNCRQPLLSWRLGPGLDCAQYGAQV